MLVSFFAIPFNDDLYQSGKTNTFLTYQRNMLVCIINTFFPSVNLVSSTGSPWNKNLFGICQLPSDAAMRPEGLSWSDAQQGRPSLIDFSSSCHGHVRRHWIRYSVPIYLHYSVIGKGVNQVIGKHGKPVQLHKRDWKNWQSPLSYFGNILWFLMRMQQCQCCFVYILYIYIHFWWFLHPCVSRHQYAATDHMYGICMGTCKNSHRLSKVHTKKYHCIFPQRGTWSW